MLIGLRNGRPEDLVSEAVELVEQSGWTLDQMSTHVRRDAVWALLLLRRTR